VNDIGTRQVQGWSRTGAGLEHWALGPRRSVLIGLGQFVDSNGGEERAGDDGGEEGAAEEPGPRRVGMVATVMTGEVR
jgi:hypothetical protein